MPFAKFLYEQARNNGLISGDEDDFEELSDFHKRDWEEYAKAVSAYLVP